MAYDKGLVLAIMAFVLYILGGIGTFGGIALIAFMRDHDLFGLGEGRSIGYLFLCAGLCLSIIGVLMMRICRNRGL